MKPIRLISGFLTVGFWTLMSRVLGFAREILILGLIGPAGGMDAELESHLMAALERRRGLITCIIVTCIIIRLFSRT